MRSLYYGEYFRRLQSKPAWRVGGTLIPNSCVIAGVVRVQTLGRVGMSRSEQKYQQKETPQGVGNPEDETNDRIICQDHKY